MGHAGTRRASPLAGGGPPGAALEGGVGVAAGGRAASSPGAAAGPAVGSGMAGHFATGAGIPACETGGVERLLLVVLVVAVAVVVAVVAERRRPAPPTQPRYPVPSQLDRADFASPEAAWLVVVFTSATCDACAAALAAARSLAGPEVVVEEVEVSARPDLHRRYGIEAVPLTVVADADGVVRAGFAGPPPPDALRAALTGP